MKDSSETIADSAKQDLAWSSRATPPETSRDRILSSATDLFCKFGFAATGVDTIVAQSGAAKSTLYNHFPSKDALVGAVLEREGAAWRKWFFQCMGAFEGPAHLKMAAVFDVLEIWFQDPHFYGCPFINAIAEGSQNEEIISTHVQRHKTEMFNWLRALALEVGHSDPDACARSMVVLIDGAIVAAQTSRDTSFAQVAKSIAVKGLIDQRG